MTEGELQEALVAMKRSLARVAMLSNRWPAPTTNVVSLNERTGLNQTSDEFKMGMEQAFNMLWSHWQAIEAGLVDQGILDQPIPLTNAETDAIPF